MDTHKLFDWLSNILNCNPGPLPSNFIISNYIFWQDGGRINAHLRVTPRFTIEVHVPFNNLWIEVYKGYSYESLIENFLERGMNPIRRAYGKYDIANTILNNISLSPSQLKELERCREINKPVYLKCISIWCVKITETVVTSRIGKDNRIDTTIKKYYGIYDSGYMIKDPYLEQFLPENTEEYDSDYAYCASGETTDYEIYKDNQATENMRASYNETKHKEVLSRL